ncbi:2-polyprenyl-3-methyl-6-methoxy-1,4-benzoquinone monooxygenase [Aliikangiella sp. G2MR2-5]|uniref:2-polyprenyl-3-methyl-6-methoxy-1,4-benzoquinone monooxygenase n=1 Tax=Aliikangiella sp. G2MR2-5 TaxID=2788943 RepID=UPI0018AC4F8E|nr:2-polyprenyl-3-methyl-6-methoxy-1,4-benzoquinone monooxygenase [Aliikangiella sp. G2MR2-5]
MRQISLADKLIMLADNSLKTLAGGYQTSNRVKPASQSGQQTEELTAEQAKHSAGLMRINHCGEVCAQALYQGQALTARLPEVRDKMEQAAIEENDHLDWCAERLQQLDSRVSLLNPLWYLGSFSIGAVAGAIGDKWSLGFVAETEHQVVRHLDDHLQKLPEKDSQSRAILMQMREDELQHATNAIAAGGAELPGPVKGVMQLMSKVMTSTVYYI